ncbi:MFS transporter [Paramicrobacterium agarici]|uniref:MFS transporter n=1 Tax=Paramicrobacterium agarici TaxID=630514 RepID=UPI001154AAEC|nr:MFS transporter [Microbacterium agarici]TQO21741.1 EmrB/QacA subfamily drug resistance transporter [Microbacterium agarici]
MFRNSHTATLLVVSVVQFMISLDLSIVNVGLPEIAEGLGFRPADLTWVIHAYALTFGGLLLLGGKAAERFGLKRMLVVGLVLFGTASLAGGFAQHPLHLITARAAQGVGAALLAPAALALLTTTFPTGAARTKAFGVWSAMNAAGGAFGVLIGGALTEFAGWRWVMFVNVPMTAVTLVLALAVVAAAPPALRAARADIAGAVLATLAMGLLVFGIVNTAHIGWTSPLTLLTFTAALVLLAGFIVVERTTRRDPLVRLTLFANRAVAGANAYNLCLGAAMAAAFYFMSLYLQNVLGHGAALTGLMFLPFALGVVVGSVLAVKLSRRCSPRALLMGGGLLTALGFGWFSLITPDGTFLTNVLGPSLAASIGFGLCLGPVVSTATMGVAPHETGMASGLLNSSRQLGAAIGLAALGTAAARYAGPHPSAHELTGGYVLGLVWCAALLVTASVIALIVLRPQRSEQAAARRTHARSTHP